MILAFKALMGALVVVLISLASRANLYYISGLIPLFPAFALMAHFITFKDGGSEGVRQAALFGLCALIPYAIYLGIIILTLDKMTFGWSVTLAIIGWCLSAAVLIWLWN